jgi:hypothetical protein
VSGGLDPRAGRTTRDEGVEMVPQIVSERSREHLWESDDEGFDRVSILRKARPGVLIVRKF